MGSHDWPFWDIISQMRITEDRPAIIEVPSETYRVIRDAVLAAGYDWLVFPDFGSFSLDGFVLRDRERRTVP